MDPSQENSQSVLQRVRRNIAILFSGTAVIALLGLGTLGLNTRALGPAQFGLLVLLQSYVVILGRVFSFDTWQAVIKFGAERNAQRDFAGLRAISSFAMAFDALSATAAGIVGLLLLTLMPQRFGLEPGVAAAAAAYTGTLFLQLPGAPVGLMRLFDRFGWLTAISIGEAALRLAASAVLFAVHSPLAAYLYAFAAVLATGNLIRIFLAFKLLKDTTGARLETDLESIRRIARPFTAFSAGSWVTGTLNVTRRDGTTLLVAALLGPSATGLYGLAVRIARPVRDLAELIRQAVFPDLSRLVANADHQTVSTVVARALAGTLPAAAAAAFGIVMFGDQAIGLFAGPDFADAYWPLVFLVLAASLYLCMPLLSSLVILYAGMRAYTLGAIAAGTMWALVVAWPMKIWGVAGAGVGELVYVVAWLAINLALLSRQRSGGSAHGRPGADPSKRLGR